MDENLLISVWKYNGRKWFSFMRECIIRAKQPDKVGKFPNWEKLFKSKRKKFKCGDFGLEIDNVLKLKAGTGCNNLRFQCFDNTKAINIITEHDEYPSVKALIMPFMIFD